MTFKISTVRGCPNFESIHVAQIEYYPLEKRDYKPFAQCRLCLNEETMFLQGWAFESPPQPDSSLVFLLAPEQGGPRLAVELRPGNQVTFSQLIEGREAVLVPEGATAHILEGENLQGIYWGSSVALPLPTLRQMWPDFTPTKGTKLRGNLLKLCAGGRSHYGSFFSTVFEPDADGAIRWQDISFGDFELVTY